MRKFGFLSYAGAKPVFAVPCAAVAAAIAACSAAYPAKYTGELHPVSGTCDQGSRAVLTRSGQSVLFTPREGVLILSGHASINGAITASQELRSMNHAPYKLILTGQIQGNRIVGTYLTPRCRYSVILNGVSG